MRVWSLRKGRDAEDVSFAVQRFVLNSINTDELLFSKHHYMIRVEVKRCKK